MERNVETVKPKLSLTCHIIPFSYILNLLQTPLIAFLIKCSLAHQTCNASQVQVITRLTDLDMHDYIAAHLLY